MRAREILQLSLKKLKILPGDISLCRVTECVIVTEICVVQYSELKSHKRSDLLATYFEDLLGN